MSLFDLQDVCIAIGSIATLDLPIVVDLIGIYGLKGPYCTLNTTDWFLQALSVIPRGSWGDVARRFTMIRWAAREEDFGKCDFLKVNRGQTGRHPNYVFLPKTQLDLNPAVHVSPYRWSQYNITGIVISFRIAGAYLGKRIPRITEDIRQDILFHLLSPSINIKYQVRSLILHALILAHFCTQHIFFRFCSRTLPDLSIGGALSDTLSTSSDQLFVVADIRKNTIQSPVARQSQAPRRDTKEKYIPIPTDPTIPSSSTWWCQLVG
ncbi:endoribonuclease Dicer1 [Dorcoceras hygrometricum]|uniref:Endoribonuclease Dicer1 n=1 Tax=Dorcoceras hygrometricum TaxID=472368 RepID=A0A2Z7CNT3_9LAMI|nr:endoribonuclease Dicer1 [Dorcoceras hygrometricum]